MSGLETGILVVQIVGLSVAIGYGCFVILYHLGKNMYKYYIKKMSKPEEEIKLEYPSVPIGIDEVRIIPAKDMMKMQSYKRTHQKTLRSNKEKKNIMGLIMKANNEGKTEIIIKKKNLPKPMKYELRKNGYLVDKLKKGCIPVVGKSMRLIKWGLDVGEGIIDDLGDIPMQGL